MDKSQVCDTVQQAFARADVQELHVVLITAWQLVPDAPLASTAMQGGFSYCSQQIASLASQTHSGQQGMLHDTAARGVRGCAGKSEGCADKSEIVGHIPSKHLKSNICEANSDAAMHSRYQVSNQHSTQLKKF